MRESENNNQNFDDFDVENLDENLNINQEMHRRNSVGGDRRRNNQLNLGPVEEDNEMEIEHVGTENNELNNANVNTNNIDNNIDNVQPVQQPENNANEANNSRVMHLAFSKEDLEQQAAMHKEEEERKEKDKLNALNEANRQNMEKESEQQRLLEEENERLRRENEKLKKEKEKIQKEKEKLERENGLAEIDPTNSNIFSGAETWEIKEAAPKVVRDKDGVGYIGVGVDPAENRKYRKDIHKLSGVAKQVDVRTRSSKEYRKLRKDLGALDEFMKDIEGRTNLSSEEMLTFDALSLNAYNATNDYLKHKDEQKADRKAANKPEYEDEKEEDRVKNAEETRKTIDELRRSMFKKEMEARKELMAKEFQKKAEELEKERGELLGKNLSGDQLKSALTKNIADSIFYQHRIKDLEAQNAFEPKAIGEPPHCEGIGDSMMRMDQNSVPNGAHESDIMGNQVAQDMVNLAISKYQNGQVLTDKEMRGMIKDEVQNKGEQLHNQNLRNNNMRPIEDVRNREQQNPTLNRNNNMSM